MSSPSSASDSPPRSVSARRAWVAPRSAASTTPALWLKLSTWAGRPPVAATSASDTSSRNEISASTRWEIVERASPVVVTRSLRVVAAPRRIRRRTAPAPLMPGADGSPCAAMPPPSLVEARAQPCSFVDSGPSPVRSDTATRRPRSSSPRPSCWTSRRSGGGARARARRALRPLPAVAPPRRPRPGRAAVARRRGRAHRVAPGSARACSRRRCATSRPSSPRRSPRSAACTPGRVWLGVGTGEAMNETPVTGGRLAGRQGAAAAARRGRRA